MLFKKAKRQLGGSSKEALITEISTKRGGLWLKRGEVRDQKRPVLGSSTDPGLLCAVDPPGLGLQGHDLQAQLPGFALQVLDGPLAGSCFIVPFFGVTILGLVLEHGIDGRANL